MHLSRIRLEKSCWTSGVLAAFAVVIVTFLPQVIFWTQCNGNWRGAFSIADTDELAYSSYLNSLLQRQPRLNNPYLPNRKLEGRESLFSLQFMPPYCIKLLAKTFSISASFAFILLTPLMAFVSTIIVYWLLVHVTDNTRVSAVGVLIVLLCGVVVSENPFSIKYDYAVFSFLRRYVPAVPFPIFFTFCLSVWCAFTHRSKTSTIGVVGAVVSFAVLVYSYFFLWTAAIAWMFCLTVTWLILRRKDRSHILNRATICLIFMAAALLPYFYLLSDRSQQIEIEQALVKTHTPDLFRFTEILAAVILLTLVYGASRKMFEWTSPLALFAAACSITPFLIFNQQIITGYSLQPFHYEQFIVNYLILIGVVVLDQLLWKVLLRRSWWCAALALIIGITLAFKTAKVGSAQNCANDEAIPVFALLQSDNGGRALPETVLFHQTLLAASAPTFSSMPVLWSHFMYAYGGVSSDENRERLFQYFYYLGFTEQEFEQAIRTVSLYRAGLFGQHRVYINITQKFDPISDSEIRAQTAAYFTYIQSFASAQACRWPLSHVVVARGQTFDYGNLDRWYQRDIGETVGGSVVYRVQLRKGICTQFVSVTN